MKHIFSLFTLLLLAASCSTAQPRIDTDTKNKKAREHFNQALGYLNIMEFENALTEVDKALKKDAKYLDALMLKGDVLKQLKRYEEAVAVYQAALSVNDKLTDLYLYMAEAQFEAMWYAQARESLEKFLESGKGETKVNKANEMLKHARFAEKAIGNPVPFNPINMGDNINTSSNEYFPGITADDQYFIFTRKLDEGYPHEDFFLCKRINDSTWGPAYNLGPPVNTNQNEGSVSISTDGQFIFFAACDRPKKNTFQGKENGARPEEVFFGCDLYFSRLDGDKWSIPRHMGPVVNSPAWESTPSLSFDGLAIYFASTRPGGLGGSDIWMTRFEDNKFSEPINLGPKINTPGDEQTPFIHPDDQTLYFASNYHPGFGRFDFFISRRDDNGNWGEPLNLGYPINTSGDEKGLLVNRSGRLAYFSSKDRKEGKGGVDIYQFELYGEARPQELSYVKAIVVDDETGAPLEAKAELLSLMTGKRVIETKTNAKTGSFLIVLGANQDYALTVNKEGYMLHSENFGLKTSGQKDPFTLTVRLKKLKVDQPVVLNNVFYEVDKFELKEESRVELDKLVEFLKSQPALKIEISGHTDNTGNKVKNQKLSEDRAKSVYDYLISKGIDPKRLSYKGYGDSKPIEDNATEEGRRKNRRTEYRITSL